MINFRFIANLMGKLLLIESAFLLLCAGIALFYREPDGTAFLYTALITALAGLLLIRFNPEREKTLTKKDGYFMVTMIWVIFALFGCLPFIFGHTIPRFVDAFFETMSGFTTTGSSVLEDIEALPHASLFWRALTQWLGGMGIITLFIAILPNLEIEGRNLYVAEVPGPTHSKTSFTFAASARRMWMIYTSLTLLETALLMFGGMDLFDGICHSLTTISSGGFSTRQASVGFWTSPYIQYVIIVFMFMGGTNFGLMDTVLQGHWRKLFKDNEFRVYVSIVLLASVVIAVCLYTTGWADVENCVRDALFQVVTVISTTGYSTVDYVKWWAPPVVFILFLLFFSGASAGSTSGGMKIVRIYLLFRNALLELKRIIHPNGIIHVKYNNKTVHPNIMSGIMGFAIFFAIILLLSTLVMTLFTENIVTACGAVLTCMSNVGPGFGSLGPACTFAPLHDFAKLFLAFLMLVGRLEIFTVTVLFTRAFWKR